MLSFEVDNSYRKTIVLEHLKTADTSISFRRSCREGVCGSDGRNINSKNGLVCITPVEDKLTNDTLIIRPLSGMGIIRDLVVDPTKAPRPAVLKLGLCCPRTAGS